MTSSRLRRRRLPHWDVPGATYFITACLAGSIPAQGLLEIARYRTQVSNRRLPELPEEERKSRAWKLIFAQTDRWLDAAPAARHLSDQRLAGVVRDAHYYFAGVRYDLLAYVIMPSHFHWVIRPTPDWERECHLSDHKRTPRERIMHSVQLRTSRECNRLAWQPRHILAA